MQIRDATHLDADAIANLHAESWRITYRGIMRDAYLDGGIFAERRRVWQERLHAPPDNQHVIVAMNGTALLGFACAMGNHDERWASLLDNLHVSAPQKRQGIGGRLLTATARWIADSHPEQGMYLWVLEQNDSARRFYERLGASSQDREIWTPPDGSQLSKLRYAWSDLAPLVRSGS